MEKKLLFIEAQRLFRRQKHGMDVVALEVLQRLKNVHTSYDISVLVKADEDACLQDNNGFTVKPLRPAFYPFWEQWILPKFTEKHPNALLHCTGNTAPLWSKTPLLVTIHDLIFLEQNYLSKYTGSLYQRFGNIYRSIVVPKIAKRARHIITVSEFQRQLIIKKLKIDPAKISVVHNGADERFFEPAGYEKMVSVSEKYGLDDSPYIFFLANTEPRKNTDGVLKAFALFCKQFPKYHHKLVIKGLSEEQLDQKISACGAAAYAHRIKRVGYIDYEDLPVLYQGAAMLWFPSFAEGFGLPIVEAMAGGTPVITSNVSVMPEIAGEAALYVDPYKPEEMVAQTVALLTDDALRNSLVEKGRARAANFTWGSAVKSLLGIYEKMVGQTVNVRTLI